ncbi:MAG: methionyl-tRNA formyltransferase [bacterium]
MHPTPSFIFFGTPDVASETLEILKGYGYIPQLIVTAPDRPVGRHFVMTPSPTKVWAIENNIPYIQPEKITDEVMEILRHPPTPSERGGGSVDLFIVVAYGKILPQALIDVPKYGTLNIHYSLLPRWRGASPVEAAILHGDYETGVSIQKMVFKLDAGPVIAEQKLVIDQHDTTQTLRGKLIPMGAKLLAEEILTRFHQLQNTPRPPLKEGEPQDESLATHCGKIKKEDALITLQDDPQVLWNKYRAYHGWPCIYFLDTEGKRVKITQARFVHGAFIPELVIPEGKKELPWTEYDK